MKTTIHIHKNNTKIYLDSHDVLHETDMDNLCDITGHIYKKTSTENFIFDSRTAILYQESSPIMYS